MMISKALVVGSYQRKLEAIASQPNVDLHVMVPPAWKDTRGSRGLLTLERSHTDGYELHVEPIRFNGSFHFHYYPTLPQRMAEIKPDIVHVDEEPYNFATFHAMRAARRYGAKTLFFTWQNIGRKYPPPFSWIERWVLNHADAALAGTDEAADVWRKKGYRGPVTVIPQFGVDPEIYSPPDKPRPKKPFVIGYAGRLVAEKGLDTLIRAALGLKGEWLIRLAGDGPERERLSSLAGILNIGGSVRFDGPLPSGDMPDWYRGVHVLALPSRTLPNWKEQFGRMLIEGMATGAAVIGSRSGAIPGVVGDAGLLFDEGDVEGLTACLQSLIDHPRLVDELVEAGRQRVLQKYTQSQIAAQTVEVYRTMVR